MTSRSLCFAALLSVLISGMINCKVSKPCDSTLNHSVDIVFEFCWLSQYTATPPRAAIDKDDDIAARADDVAHDDEVKELMITRFP